MTKAIWNAAYASAIGQAHLNQGTACQDRFACDTINSPEGEILVAVVADGAGSTTHGQIGAEIACNYFVEEVRDFLSTNGATLNSLQADFGKFWVTFYQQKLAVVAKNEEKPLREFATTMVAAAVGENFAAFFQIGDGGVVFSESGEDQSYVFAIPPEDSDYVNMTDFLSDEDAAEKIRFVRIEKRIEELCLFSDGIFPVAVNYQTNSPHEPFLKPMIAPLRNLPNGNQDLNKKLEAFLSSPQINEKSDDDKTIILASRKK